MHGHVPRMFNYVIPMKENIGMLNQKSKRNSTLDICSKPTVTSYKKKCIGPIF